MCCPSSVASDVQCFKVIDFTKWLHSVLFAISVQMFQFHCHHARLNVCYTIRNLLVMQWLFNFSVYLIMDRRVLLRQECVWNETGGSAQWWRKWQQVSCSRHWDAEANYYRGVWGNVIMSPTISSMRQCHHEPICIMYEAMSSWAQLYLVWGNVIMSPSISCIAFQFSTKLLGFIVFIKVFARAVGHNTVQK